MNASSADPLRGARGSLPGTAGPLLLPGLATPTGDLRSDFRLMRSEPRIGHLPRVRLMHQIHIDRGFKDFRGQIHLAYLLALQIENIYFHDNSGSQIRARLLLARLLDQHEAALATGNRTIDRQQVAFCIHQDNLDVMRGNAIDTHVSGPARTFEHPAWRRA